MGRNRGSRDRFDEIEPVEFVDVECIAQTERAVLCVIDGVQRWIPQSQITPLSEVWQHGDKGTLILTRWFARKEGLCND